MSAFNRFAKRGQATGKHKNKSVEYCGEKFASKRELDRWKDLQLMYGARKIRDLQRQVVYVLVPPVIMNGRKKPAIRYVCDAAYFDIEKGVRIVEDSKSPHLRKNPVYRLKKHLMKHVHGIEIKEV